jgi:hypothetical protein
MVNHDLPNQTKLDVNAATAGILLLALTLVFAYVLRLYIREQHLPENGLQMLPTALVDTARPRRPVRLSQLPIGVDGT